MDTQMVACPKCGAHNPKGSQWCSQCYSSLTGGEPQDASVDRRQELAAEEERRNANRTGAAARGRPIYSRLRGSETSFGIVGRILATLVVVGVGVFIYLFAFTIIPVVIWVVVAVPVLFGAIWKRTLVGYEER